MPMCRIRDIRGGQKVSGIRMVEGQGAHEGRPPFPDRRKRDTDGHFN